MNRVVIFVGIVSVVTVSGCGGGSVEHEQFESPEFSGQRTRIHVQSNDSSRPSHRVVEDQPINLHFHSANGQSICIEITTGKD